MKKRPLAALIILMSLAWAGCILDTEAGDKAALRRQCHIPAYAVLVQFTGYPSRAGFGQREGLSISGRFRIPEKDAGRFEGEAKAGGWKELPIPESVRSQIWYRPFESSLELQRGLYRCFTASDDVLHAKKIVPIGTDRKPNDLIISIYDRSTGNLYAAIKSAY
jgi:hypothetical protein